MAARKASAALGIQFRQQKIPRQCALPRVTAYSAMSDHLGWPGERYIEDHCFTTVLVMRGHLKSSI
jgi:hypothetical protein